MMYEIDSWPLSVNPGGIPRFSVEGQWRVLKSPVGCPLQAIPNRFWLPDSLERPSDGETYFNPRP